MHVADKILNVWCADYITYVTYSWEKIDANCSKDVSSSSEISESFTETDESVYSEISSESGSDSYYSNEYYESNISRDLSAAVDTQNQNNDDQWI